jgi:hypothetical protein
MKQNKKGSLGTSTGRIPLRINTRLMYQKKTIKVNIIYNEVQFLGIDRIFLYEMKAMLALQNEANPRDSIPVLRRGIKTKKPPQG